MQLKQVNRPVPISIMNADLIYHEFGWDALVRTPGHQEIEIGLVKLCRATGNKKYFDLARFFLDARGPDGQKQKYKWRIPGGNINPLPPLE